MKAPHIFTGPGLSRRSFLRASGISMALPFLEAMRPAFGRGASDSGAPKRMVCVMTNMGVLQRYYLPKTAGRNYETTPYLEFLREHRNQMTVISGTSHPGVNGNHFSERSFLSAAPGSGGSNFKNTISVDQFAAEQIGDLARFPSLVLRVGKEHNGLISQTRDGVPLPPENKPSRLYQRLFLQGTPEEVETQITDLRKGGSILDFVQDEAKSLTRGLGSHDKERLDQYFTSVRDLEQRLHHSEEWERKPKAVAKVPAPKDITDDTEVQGQTNLMYDMVRLALETDSTRIISLYLNPLQVTANIPGVTMETHTLTHHGNDEEKIEELRKIEEIQFQCLAKLLGNLSSAKEEGRSLLDNTMLLYGSNLGNGNSHDTANLPVIFAGGGFKHGTHLAFNQQHNTPLANLFVTMLQNLGIERDKFATSTGTLTGLEKA